MEMVVEEQGILGEAAELGADAAEVVADAEKADADAAEADAEAVDLDDADSPKDSFLVTLRSLSLSERRTGGGRGGGSAGRLRVRGDW